MISYPAVFITDFIFFTLLFIYFLYSKKTISLWLIIGLQILASALLLKEVGDIMLFSGAGWHLRHKIDYYFIDADHSMYPFFPFLIFLYAPLNLLTEIISTLTFSFYLKLFLILASYFFTKQIKSKTQKLLFLTSPITYSIVIFHGQTDIILLLFLFLSLKAVQSKKTIQSAIFYGFSIATKTWSAALAPFMLQNISNLKNKALFLFTSFSLLFFNVFFYTRYVFGSGFRVVLPAVINAGGPVGQWGWTYLLSSLKGFHVWFPPISLYCFTGLFILGQLLIYKKNLPLFSKLVLNLLLIYLIIPKWGIQYLFWLWPFLFISKLTTKLPFIKLYYLLTAIYLFLNYLNVALSQNFIPPQIIYPLGFVLYLLFAYWFSFLLRLVPKQTAQVQ